MKNKTVKEKVIEILENVEDYGCEVETAFKRINKLYRKEMLKFLKEYQNGYEVFNKIKSQKIDTKSPVSIHSQKDVNKVSYTCCDIEVSEPKGTEVMCPECKEWVTTK